MRADAVGFFWNDAPIPKPPKPAAEKARPPERTWERPDYLPGLEEALRFPVEQFTDYTLMSEIGNELVFDIETYPNFFQVGFMSLKTGRVMRFVMTFQQALDVQRLYWVTQNFTLISFNGNHYDVPMLSLALAGYDNAALKAASNAIIGTEFEAEKHWLVLKAHKVKQLKCNHIDLMEVCPLAASLKIYGGRVSAPRMQDLPFPHETHLSPEQMAIVSWYNVNDMVNTAYLYTHLEEPLALRKQMSQEYGLDLRSKSDAQIAEAVIALQIQALQGKRPGKPVIDVGTTFWYKVPEYMAFHTAGMQQALDIVRRTRFIVGMDGRIAKPPELEGLQVQIGKAVYTLGIGGLHSTEKRVTNRAVGGYKIFDIDMESYYPRIMLNQGLYPTHIGPVFLEVFNSIVERRIAAKRAGDKSTANSLKITINGTYGKLGSPYSIFYAPDLLTQVTLTGQLSILMLIEWLEAYGIEVISANTDGIAVKVHESQMAVKDHVVSTWSKMVQFKPEENEYLSMHNKDVNNYIAFKPDGTSKGKGEYSNPWKDKKDLTERLKKNPTATICVEAVEAFISKQIAVEDTIRQCSDLRKFISVRKVKGGAVKNGEFFGRALRWYYSKNEKGVIIDADNGHTVGRSEGAKPVMTLPDTFPDDIDYDWYIQRAERILKDIAVIQ